MKTPRSAPTRRSISTPATTISGSRPPARTTRPRQVPGACRSATPTRRIELVDYALAAFIAVPGISERMHDNADVRDAARRAAMSALSLDNVTKRFDRTLAVDQLSFSVPEGQVFGFLGGNGAGKTTTLRMALDII